MERISVYIDGGNFYHLVIKKLGIEENDFDFDAFANLLINGRTASENCKRFYKGSIREKEGDLRSKKLMSKQTKLFTLLKKNGWDIKTSKLRTRVEELIVDSRVLEYEKLKKIGIEWSGPIVSMARINSICVHSWTTRKSGDYTHNPQ